MSQPLYWKDDILFTCPKCGYSYHYTCYLNTTSIICNECDEETEVELHASNVEFKAT